MNNSANRILPTTRSEAGGEQTLLSCSVSQRITHNAIMGTVPLVDDTYNYRFPKSDDGSLSGLYLITRL